MFDLPPSVMTPSRSFALSTQKQPTRTRHHLNLANAALIMPIYSCSFCAPRGPPMTPPEHLESLGIPPFALHNASAPSLLLARRHCMVHHTQAKTHPSSQCHRPSCHILHPHMIRTSAAVLNQWSHATDGISPCISAAENWIVDLTNYFLSYRGSRVQQTGYFAK